MTLDQTPATYPAAKHREPAAHDASRAGWQRNWEFWLAVVLAGFLRLWHIELTQFLKDQVDLMMLTRPAVVHGVLPITATYSSIGTYHPPLAVYFLLPIYFFTTNPLPGVISIALVNVLAVALTYIFALRYFGRTVAGAAALLFATSDTLINYSRFLWQPNYIAFVTLLMVMALYRGCVRGKPNFLVIGTVLFLADVLVHPANLLLAPIVVLALVAAPTRPARRAWLAGASVALVLLIPSVLYEGVISRFANLRRYVHSSGGAKFDLQVLHALAGLFDGPGGFGAPGTAVYDAYSGFYPALKVAAVLLFSAGILALTARVALPFVRGWRRQNGAEMQVPARLLALWRGVTADSAWRTRALLWIWIAAPLAVLLRHSTDVTVHYLLFLVPGVFVVQGLGMREIIHAVRTFKLPARMGATRAPSPAARRVVGLGVLCLVGILVAGQSVRWMLYPASLASGEFVAYDGYGFPLAEMQDAEARLSSVQREQHASAAYVVTPEHGRYGEPFDYLFANERSDRTTFDLHCLVLPAPGDGPVLIMTTQPDTAPASLLANLPGATHVADIPMAGGAPFEVYRVQGAPQTLAGERALSPVTFSDGAGHGLRLQGAALVQSTVLRLRWTVLDRPDESAQPRYRVSVNVGATQSNVAGMTGRTDCVSTHLHAGQTLITWITLPQGTGAMPSDAPLSVRVQRNTAGVDMPTVGPFRFLTGRPGDTPMVTFSRPGGASGAPTTEPYTLPPGALTAGQ